MFHDGTKDVGAHRFSYELAFGPIPPGLFLLHKCDNPGCVNPAHLIPGTQKDNIADMYNKGRGHVGDDHWSRLRPTDTARGERNGHARLTETAVCQIREMREQGARIKDIAARFGVTPTTACDIVKRRSWKHIA